MAFFTKKKIIIGLILLAAIAGGAFIFTRSSTNPEDVVTEKSEIKDIKQTVLATGQVSSSTDLKLSFKGSGVVRKITVKVGDKVKENQILANLDQRDQLAALTQARGVLAQAQANYKKVVDGASSEEVVIAQKSVDAATVSLNNAKRNLSDTISQQEQLVKNARKALYNSTISATAGVGTNSVLNVSGAYNGSDAGTYYVSIYNSGGGVRYQYSGLESGSDYLVTTGLLQLGTKGLYVSFPSSYNITDSWSLEIPNTKASTYVANLNAYNAALESQRSAISAAENAISTAQASLDTAIAQLNAKKASARPADVAAATAQITSAQGQVLAAEASLENTVITAPAEGTITTIDIKVGQQFAPGQSAIVLQNVDSLLVEANISEANIAEVKVGQSVSFTFDALGPDKEFTGSVQLIDPASTVVSGVVNYKVTASLDKQEEIKPGMTANMIVLTNQKQKVLTIPQRAVLNKDGKKIVRVINNSKKKTFDEVVVQTGLEADGGLIEITNGLSVGTEIVTFIKTKK